MGRMLVFGAVVAAAIAGFPAVADDDTMVWPLFVHVIKPGDLDMRCPRLKAEVNTVEAGIRQMRKARHRVEDMLSDLAVGQDMRDENGNPTTRGIISPMSTAANQKTLVETRNAITGSLAIALQRLEHLKKLQADCRPE